VEVVTKSPLLVIDDGMGRHDIVLLLVIIGINHSRTGVVTYLHHPGQRVASHVKWKSLAVSENIVTVSSSCRHFPEGICCSESFRGDQPGLCPLRKSFAHRRKYNKHFADEARGSQRRNCSSHRHGIGKGKETGYGFIHGISVISVKSQVSVS